MSAQSENLAVCNFFLTSSAVVISLLKPTNVDTIKNGPIRSSVIIKNIGELPKMESNITNQISEELYRIHSYASAMAKLCQGAGQSNALQPVQLEQIFKDIAKVTGDASAHLETSILPQINKGQLSYKGNGCI